MIRVVGMVLYMGLGDFVWGCCLGKQLPFYQTKFNKELRFNSLTSYFFHRVLFMISRLMCSVQIMT